MSDPAGMSARERPWRWLALAVTLSVLTWVGFGRSRGDFFVGDDFVVTYATSRVTNAKEAIDIDGAFRQQLIREVYPDFTFTSTLVRPLPALSFWFDYRRCGNDPSGYHDTSLLLHVLAALLVAALAFALSKNFVAACIAGAFFAVHPAHPEAVVWIAARSDPLVTVWMLGTLLCLLRYVDGGGGGWLALACASCAGALASKEMAATVPALACVLAAARTAPSRWRRALIGTGALVVVLAAYVAYRATAFGLSSYATVGGGLGGQLSNAVRFVRDATLACVWPGDRVAHPGADVLRALFAAAGLVLFMLAWRQRGWFRVLLAAAIAFAVSTAPVAVWAALPPNGEGARLIYPSLGFVAVAVGAAGAAAFTTQRALAVLAAACMFAAALLGLWRAQEPWHRAAATSQAIVLGLRDVAAGKRSFVLVHDLPAKDGPAYLAQNAFPPAIWLFVSRGARVEWLSRPAWDAFVAEHGATLAREPSVIALRWDQAQRVWLGPDGRPARPQ
jgi:hypothetical protein